MHSCPQKLAAGLLLALAGMASADDDRPRGWGKSKQDPAPAAAPAGQQASEQAEALRDYLGRDMVFISSPAIESYLTDIATALLATRKDPPPVPRFLVQSTDEFTVFTDARGNIVVGSAVLREVESEDELAGVEMVRDANYDVAAFSSLFARIDAAHAVRSDRVERLRQEALKKAGAKAPAPRPASARTSVRDSTRAALRQAGSDAEAGVIETLFNGLAGWGTDYDPPEQRTTAVLEYVQQTSTGRRDKTRRSPRFAAELRDGAGGRLLEADRAALAVLRATNSRTPESARAEAALLFASAAGGEPLSPHLNLAMGSWLEAQRRPAEAEQRAVAWSGTALAPRTAYLWRASYQTGRQDYPAALDTLERGADRLGDRSLFLPQMVATARSAGDLPRAEQLATECGRARIGLDLGTLSRALGRDKPAKATGLYGECVAALGYDPIEKSQQARKSQQADPGRAQQKADEINK